MNRMWTIYHALLTFACAGCCAYLLFRDRPTAPVPAQPPPDETTYDQMLADSVRQYLGVQWIGGPILIPPGEDHFGITLLHYRDGKFVRRAAQFMSRLENPSQRAVQYVLMWGPDSEMPPRAVVCTGYDRRKVPDELTTFLAKTQKWSRRFGDADGTGERFHGYLVKGVVGGNEMRPGHEDRENSSLDAGRAIEWRRDVVILGLKTFPTEKAAERWLFEKGADDNP